MANMHLAVSTPLSARCTFCTTYTEGAECEHVNMWCSGTAVCALVALVHTQPAHCPFCSTPVLQPRVLLVIRKHSISVGRSSVSRPRAECAEKVLSSSSFGTLVLHSSSSSSSTVPAAAGGGSGRGLAGAGVPPPRRCWAEKVKRCETAASTGSWPRPGPSQPGDFYFYNHRHKSPPTAKQPSSEMPRAMQPFHSILVFFKISIHIIAKVSQTSHRLSEPSAAQMFPKSNQV